jgi:hypothetical protein
LLVEKVSDERFTLTSPDAPDMPTTTDPVGALVNTIEYEVLPPSVIDKDVGFTATFGVSLARSVNATVAEALL